MLYLLGNPNETIQIPGIHYAFMIGVESFVNLYLKIEITIYENKRYIAPNANTILHIFGRWLFDCIHLHRSGFEEGTSLAIKILSMIITTKHLTSILDIYISSFYSCLQRALEDSGRVLVAAIVNTTSLFTKNIKGIRCLIPSFVAAIQKVLQNNITCDASIIQPEHLRKASLQIFSSIMCLPNHFGDTPFTLKASSLEASSYASLKIIYSSILTEALVKETSNGNIEYLLNLAYSWVCEDILNNCDFARQLIGLIIRKISQLRWSPEVVVVSCKILALLSSFYDKIDKGFEQANLIVDQLCRLIISYGNPCTNQQELIIVAAFNCTLNWILTDQWVFNYKETREILLDAFVICIYGKTHEKSSKAFNRNASASNLAAQVVSNASDKKGSAAASKKEKSSNPKTEVVQNSPLEVSEKLKQTAYHTLLMLLNHIGNFPTASGASTVSSLALEQEILAEIIAESNGAVTEETSKEYIRYYITDDKVILSLIDRCYHPAGPCCTIVVRDLTGRYVWDTHLNYTPGKVGEYRPNYTPNDLYPTVPVTIHPYQSTTSNSVDFNDIKNVLAYLESRTESTYKDTFKIVDSQLQQEFKVLKNNHFSLNTDVSLSIQQPANPYIGDCKIQYSRMFLSHLGYLSLENRDKLFPLSTTPAFFQTLRQLDNSCERKCISVGVLYARKGQSEDEWFANEGGSMDYQEFIATLGWGINVSTHKGFTGQLDRKNTTLVTPYWSSALTEIVFQVPTLLKNNETDIAMKQKLVLENCAMIVWVEDLSNFQPQLIWKRVRYNIIIIAIIPLDFGLYSIRLYSKNDMYSLGPIIDGSIVSKDILGKLVRETVISAYDKENSDKPSSLSIRCDTIDRIYNNFKRICSLEQFYVLQFTSTSTDQIGPSQVEPWTTEIIYQPNTGSVSVAPGLPSMHSASTPSITTPAASITPQSQQPVPTTPPKKDKGRPGKKESKERPLSNSVKASPGWLGTVRGNKARPTTSNTPTSGSQRSAEPEPKESKKSKK